MSSPELCFLTATELTHRLHTKQISAREVMAAHLAQIERVNPKVNAIITLLPPLAVKLCPMAPPEIVAWLPAPAVEFRPSEPPEMAT